MHFHPIIQDWFTAELGQPTRVQELGWEAVRSGQHTLIAAPTGSGKTLAAFLTAIDDLLREALCAPLSDEVRVVYVSPLKALSTDIHKNLAEPLRQIEQRAAAAGLPPARITAAVRTGDTTASARAAMLKSPPHILVTTPESLYLLLTADRSRQMLRTVRAVIVDEIHAVIGTRRGAHLALSLERLRQVADQPFLRLGLSATQKPIDEVSRFLVGAGDPRRCVIVDEGHRRAMDLGVEIPKSPLDAVMSHEVWEEYYDRLAELVREHKTTLIFVNTRRLAERMARHLSERLGEDQVTAHHGSLAKETRLDAETRLKTGQLRALVATASLELGIDIGHADLVCQVGSPHRIATLLQRVGRSGHTVNGVPKGRVFPVSRDDLFECAALLRSIREGELDAIVWQDAPLDVLAQQIVAECACRDYAEDELYTWARHAWPYRNLGREDFDAVLKMVADGFSTRRGRRAALVHRDEINRRVRGRRGSRLLAQTCGGAIPEVADYRVVLEPEETFIGTVNEDFAIESMGGDVFQLGNTSWRVLQVTTGTVRVEDARGTPPNIPFWFGEAPARSDELSAAVSRLRRDLAGIIQHEGDGIDWLVRETGIPQDAARQTVEFVAEGVKVLGTVPTQETLVLERFFDEAGGMQLVLHSPFGSRINKAWGLALRKRFCRQFNFELQAAATDDAVLLSLGPQHSFPLADVFRYLHPESARDVLVQAFLDAPVFQTRWRWNTTIALAVPRSRGGRKVAPQLQRMLADDLMASVFPDAAACLENIPGDREIPDHPLVKQTVQDCLQEAMDCDGLRRVLQRIHHGDLHLMARDTTEPSTFCHDILNARVYAFLDDAPLEERRTHAVHARRAGEPSSARDLGMLDVAAIDRVREEQRPEPRDADELHDALLLTGFLTDEEISDYTLLDALAGAGRACRVSTGVIAGAAVSGPRLWMATERMPEAHAIYPRITCEPRVTAPASRERSWTREDAVKELIRGRMTILGPTTAAKLAQSLSIGAGDVDGALLALESEGVVLRGRFTPPSGAGHADALEWCDRALLARIHRYTLNRLRAEIEPVSAADFMRFLFRWQHVARGDCLSGIDGLREIVAQLDGFELPAGAWERAVFPARLDGYEPHMLDLLCLAGEVGWARLTSTPPDASRRPRLVPATPVALFLREHGDVWATLIASEHPPNDPSLSDDARLVLETLRTKGASFLKDVAAHTGLDQGRVEEAVGGLVACGLVTSDGFSGLRALVLAAQGRSTRDRRATFAGRWSARVAADSRGSHSDAAEAFAWALLRRYGVVFKRLLAREASTVPWRELTRIYRRLEARGEIRGGRFVTGMSGEQFALPRAIEVLREVRRTRHDDRIITISAADPLNLVGIVTGSSPARVRAATRNRIAYRNGVPIAVREGEIIRELTPLSTDTHAEASRALKPRQAFAMH